jgi:hypothetical protein
MSTPVTIRDFVSNSIIQIAQGINDVRDFGIDGLLVFPGVENDRMENSEIVFDLAVTANESDQTGTKGGGGISIMSGLFKFEGGGETGREKTVEASSISRLSFSIKVRFPGDFSRQEVNMKRLGDM